MYAYVLCGRQRKAQSTLCPFPRSFALSLSTVLTVYLSYYLPRSLYLPFVHAVSFKVFFFLLVRRGGRADCVGLPPRALETLLPSWRPSLPLLLWRPSSCLCSTPPPFPAPKEPKFQVPDILHVHSIVPVGPTLHSVPSVLTVSSELA